MGDQRTAEQVAADEALEAAIAQSITAYGYEGRLDDFVVTASTILQEDQDQYVMLYRFGTRAHVALGLMETTLLHLRSVPAETEAR